MSMDTHTHINTYNGRGARDGYITAIAIIKLIDIFIYWHGFIQLLYNKITFNHVHRLIIMRTIDIIVKP